MPLPTHVQTILQHVASNPAVSAQIAQTQGKVYELWIVANIANALRLRGWRVEIRSYDDSQISHFVQRGSPGFIQPGHLPPSHPGFFWLRRPRDGEEFEMHNSVVFCGRSGTQHEFDICILKRNIGSSLRACQVAEAAVGHPMFAVECKDYANSVGVAVPRSLIASTFDATRWRRRALSHDRLHEGGAVISYTAMAGRFKRTFSAIVAPNGFTLGAYQLATHYNIKLFDHVEHGTPQTVAFLGRAVGWMNAYSG